MSVSLSTLISRTRRFLRDWPLLQDPLLVSLGASGTTVVVTDTTVFPTGTTRYLIELGTEAMLVKSISSASLTVTRSYADTTAVSYAASTNILVQPSWLAVEIIDALNAAKDEMYPYIYKPVLDTSLSADSDTYEFTIPSTIKHLASVEIQLQNETPYRPIHNWRVRRAATPKVQFRVAPETGTLRLHGFGPFDDLSATTDTTDSLFPTNAERPLVLGAASRLLASGEAGRSRADTGLRDDREAANRPGTSISLANHLERRFEKELARAAMPPLPHHVMSVM